MRYFYPIQFICIRWIFTDKLINYPLVIVKENESNENMLKKLRGHHCIEIYINIKRFTIFCPIFLKE